MPDQSSCGSVTVFIYKPEFDYLKWLVLQKRKIETGGDLFGLWQDENKAVVQFILGPGEHCKRTTTSFHQDVDYLREVGGYLTSSQGLCNIGEWHSHHTLGLAEPSYGDQQTVWNHISSVAGGRFLVFIANIRGTEPKVNVGCFLFNWNNEEMLRGNIKCLPYDSPVRLAVKNPHITSNAELTQDWKTYMNYQTPMKKNKNIVVDNSSSKDGPGTSHKSSTKNDNQNERDGNRNTRNGNRKNKNLLTTNVLNNSPKDGNNISNTSSTGNDRLASRNGNMNIGKDKDNTKNIKSPTPKAQSHTSNDNNGISNSHTTENGSHDSRNSDMNRRNGKANTRNVNPSTPKVEDHTSIDDSGLSNIPKTRDNNRNVGDNKTNTKSTSSHVGNENSNIKNSKPSKKNKQFNRSKTTSKTKKGKSKNKPRQIKRVRYEQQLRANDCGVKKLSKCRKIVKILWELSPIAIIIIIIYVAVVNKITLFR